METVNTTVRELGVLIEHNASQTQLILEILQSQQRQIAQLPTRDEFNELKSDLKIVKAAVTDSGAQLHDHERRIAHLEAKA